MNAHDNTDPTPGCCQVEIHGRRCHYPGVWSNSTTGGGTWMCAKHSERRPIDEASRIISQSHLDIPEPDYSYEARRRASDIAHASKQPDYLKGWTEDEYRAHIRTGILKLAEKATGGQPRAVAKPDSYRA